MTEVGLAEGIERMSLQYGIDNLPAGATDNIVDTFLTNPADFSNVLAVRVTLLVRATTPNAQYDDTGKTYDLNGDNIPDYDCTLDVLTPAPCSYKRKVFSQLFQLRNVIAHRKGL
jgi:hypothetical protein